MRAVAISPKMIAKIMTAFGSVSCSLSIKIEARKALSLLSAALYADGAMALSYCDLSSVGSSSADFCGGGCTVVVVSAQSALRLELRKQSSLQSDSVSLSIQAMPSQLDLLERWKRPGSDKL